jgi:hypothetical protein
MRRFEFSDVTVVYVDLRCVQFWRSVEEEHGTGTRATERNGYHGE